MTVKDIIERIRTSTHDCQEIGYTDAVLLGYINDGYRIMRRTIADIAPLTLAETITGKLEADEDGYVPDTITFEDKIATFVDVVVDGNRLKQVNWQDITELKDNGKPEYYYVVGFNAVSIYPHPKECAYRFLVIKDIKLLGMEDESPLPDDLNDFIYEYAAARASISNEFDISQEMSVISNIVSQVEAYLNRRSPHHITVDGYWG